MSVHGHSITINLETLFEATLEPGQPPGTQDHVDFTGTVTVKGAEVLTAADFGATVPWG